MHGDDFTESMLHNTVDALLDNQEPFLVTKGGCINGYFAARKCIEVNLKNHWSAYRINELYSFLRRCVEYYCTSRKAYYGNGHHWVFHGYPTKDLKEEFNEFRYKLKRLGYI